MTARIIGPSLPGDRMNWRAQSIMLGLAPALRRWDTHYEDLIRRARVPFGMGEHTVRTLYAFLRDHATFRTEGYTHPDRYKTDEVAIRVDRLQGDCDDLNIYALGGGSVYAGVPPAFLFSNWLPNRLHARHVRLAIPNGHRFTTFDLQNRTVLSDQEEGEYEPWSNYISARLTRTP